MIPYGRQSILEADIQAVVGVLRSEYLTQGPTVPAFEDAVAKYCHTQYAVAVNSATSALHIACLALGVGKGDIVWTSPITFVASANCALFCGAVIDFIDIDTNTYNLSVEQLKVKLESAEKKGKLPKVVIAVHLAGQSCDMQVIYELSQKYGFKIIEDASHAIGGRYNGQPIGNCKYSDIVIFSFHPVKIITTGEGGMALTNKEELAECMRLLRSHGITRDESKMNQDTDGPWYYQQISLGFNYRMTDIQAAIGLSQMNKLDDFVKKRHEIANIYDQKLRFLPLKTPWQNSNSYSAYHLYVVRLEISKINLQHKQVFENLRSLGIGVNLHYIPIYRHPFYSQYGFKSDDFPEAEKYYAEAISLPVYAGLTVEMQNEVIDIFSQILKS
jgi:UDP-4-amino-4,6-dideoxy-N-acetyl-beta-L-altrosamine transaminase